MESEQGHEKIINSALQMFFNFTTLTINYIWVERKKTRRCILCILCILLMAVTYFAINDLQLIISN